MKIVIKDAPGPEDYDDIVAWLNTGSIMCDAAGKKGGYTAGGFIAKGMRIAADKIVALEAEVARLKQVVAGQSRFPRMGGGE